MSRNDLYLKVWKTQEEGIAVLEEAAKVAGISTRRLEKDGKCVLIIGRSIAEPELLLRHREKGTLHGYSATEIVKDADGKAARGKVLYSGIDPLIAVRYAAGERVVDENGRMIYPRVNGG